MSRRRLERNATTAAPPDDPANRPAPATLPGTTVAAAEVLSAAPSAPCGAPHLAGYRIIAKLGQGGMGTVWLAVQLSTRRQVALKMLSTGIGASPRAQARFDREVELAARLEHPNLARVYDSGVDQGMYFYAMELIEGQHLDAYVADRRCTRRPIIELMRTVCRAMQHAHQRGVIHRDLKPSNILVTPDGVPHVVDFGLAKTLLEDDASRRISVDGEIAGTPAFMSPEQAAGRTAQVDTRSDVYSLGVILYELLTGQLPHDPSGTSFQVMKRIIEQDVRSPRSISRTIDRELEALLLKALARDPNRRYASAGEMANDLDNYLSGDPLTAKKPTTTYFLIKKMRKHRVPLGIMLAAVLPLGMWVLYQWRSVVTLPISTDPPGAALYVDGKLHSCGTPCYLKLPPGRHTVEIAHPGPYQRTRRVYEVGWGRAMVVEAIENLHESEPIPLRPAFERVMFRSQPPGAIADISGAGGRFLVDMNRQIELPMGTYRIVFKKDGYVDEEAEYEVNVLGSREPRTIQRKLTRADGAK